MNFRQSGGLESVTSLSCRFDVRRGSSACGDDAVEARCRAGVASVATVAARRNDVGDDFEIEFGDGLERLGGRAIGESFGLLVPCGVFGLQGEQFGDGSRQR